MVFLSVKHCDRGSYLYGICGAGWYLWHDWSKTNIMNYLLLGAFFYLDFTSHFSFHTETQFYGCLLVEKYHWVFIRNSEKIVSIGMSRRKMRQLKSIAYARVSSQVTSSNCIVKNDCRFFITLNINYTPHVCRLLK